MKQILHADRTKGIDIMERKHVRYDGDIDKRIIEKKLLKGEITEKDLEEYLAQLPDVSDNAEEVWIDFEKEES